MAIDFNSQRLRRSAAVGEIGIEKECLRVSVDGRLANTPHPFSEDEPNIDRDFCENQIEFISDVFTDSAQLIAHLNTLHNKAYGKAYRNDELLWSFSNPPYVSGEEEIQIARFSEKRRGKQLYRDYLAAKYGKMKMLFSGIHYNFSFTDEFLEQAVVNKDEFYLDLAKKLVKYSWLIVYLTAASPVLDDSYIKNTALTANDKYRYSSVRCSEAGYWNDFIPILRYTSLDEYVNSIEEYVSSGLLRSSSELYYPVRIKPTGKNTLDNLRNGINHIELRMLDLNPFSRVGILKEDIDFIHLLILWLTTLESFEFTTREQTAAVRNIKKAALYDDKAVFLNIDGNQLTTKEAARSVLKDICVFCYKYFPQFKDAIDFQLSKLNNPERRYAYAVREQFGNDYARFGLELAKKYAREAEKDV